MKFLFFMIAFNFILAASVSEASTENLIKNVEKQISGRIGLFAIDIKSGRTIGYRSNERFLMCSTFKAVLCAQILHNIDLKNESLDRVIRYSQVDVLSYAPITSRPENKYAMKVGDLCAAALQYSDNTAANLLLKIQGGPSGLTNYLRSIGDTMTSLDRIEPDLNTQSGNFDTTTPKAMALTLKKLLIENKLSQTSRDQLKTWLLKNETGIHRLKAGLPTGWTIADKTGTGDNGITNDIGVIYRADGSPIVVAAYVNGSSQTREKLETTLAELGKIVASEYSR